MRDRILRSRTMMLACPNIRVSFYSIASRSHGCSQGACGWCWRLSSPSPPPPLPANAPIATPSLCPPLTLPTPSLPLPANAPPSLPHRYSHANAPPRYPIATPIPHPPYPLPCLPMPSISSIPNTLSPIPRIQLAPAIGMAASCLCYPYCC